MDEYISGILTAVTTMIVILFSLVWYFLLRPGSQGSKRLYMHYKSAYKPSNPNANTTIESLQWINNLLERLFSDVVNFEFTYNTMISRLEQLINSKLPPDLMEPFCINRFELSGPPKFHSIESSEQHLKLSVEWSRKITFSFSTAVCYKSLIALPFNVSVTLDALKMTAYLELHSHYFSWQLIDEFTLDMSISSSIGHQFPIVDNAALHDYIKSLLVQAIKESCIDSAQIVPYAAIMTLIPRSLSPPMSPTIPMEALLSSHSLLLHDDSFHDSIE